MNQTLQRLQQTVSAQLADPRLRCAGPGSTTGALATRASRLNDRIQMLHFKLRNAYSASGVDEPVNLRAALQGLADLDRDGAPPEYLCPISQVLMVDPVATCDGQVYDRPSILEWFATFAQATAPTSPLTNLPLANADLNPQGPLRRRIAHFMRTGVVVPEGADVSAAVDEGGASATAVLAAAPHGERGDDAGEGVHDDDAALRSLRSGPFERDEAQRTAVAQRAKQEALHRAPIWSSAVVPAGEENSRVLNLLRVYEGPSPAGGPDADGGAGDACAAKLSRPPAAAPVVVPPMAAGRTRTSMLPSLLSRGGRCAPLAPNVPGRRSASAAAAVPSPHAGVGRRRDLYIFAPAAPSSRAADTATAGSAPAPQRGLSGGAAPVRRPAGRPLVSVRTPSFLSKR